MSTERVAPQNLAAEESALGAILLAGSDGPEASSAVVAAVRATGLEARDFYRESHALVYEAALAVVERGEPTVALTIEHELRVRQKLTAAGGEKRLGELAALAPTTSNAAHYAKLVVETADRREAFGLGLALQVAAVNGSVAADPALRERIAEQLRPPRSAAESGLPAAPWRSQPWPEFRDGAGDEHSWLVQGLLPAGMLAFVAGPPKKGKTWLGLALALALATGRPLFGVYSVPEPRNVLYVALEGSRVGIRSRIGALARGLELDPDGRRSRSADDALPSAPVRPRRTQDGDVAARRRPKGSTRRS